MDAEHLLVFPDRDVAEQVAAQLEAAGLQGVRVVREALAGEDDSEAHEWGVYVSTPDEPAMPWSSSRWPSATTAGTTATRTAEPADAQRGLRRNGRQVRRRGARLEACSAELQPPGKEGTAMSETYTVSVWSTEGVDGEAFVDAFRSFAAAATESGGAREGMILQDVSDPSRYFIIRRWDDPDAVQRWGSAKRITRRV